MSRNEINEEVLNEVAGGICYNRETKVIGLDRNHMDYHYDDYDAVFNWVSQNVLSFDPETCVQDIIDGLLAAGLIH